MRRCSALLALLLATAGGFDVAWDTVVRLTNDPASQYAGFGGQRPVAVDPAGNVWVVWVDQRTVPYQLWYRKRDALTGWQPEQQLTSRPVSCFPAAVAADGAGNVHVAWHLDGWPDRGIWYKRYDAARAAWLPETLVHPLASHRTGQYPVLATAPGSARVQLVWYGHTDTGTYWQVLHREYRPDSGWSEAFPVTTVLCSHDQSSVAADSAGNVYVVWCGMDRSSQYNHIHHRRRVAGEWQDIECVSDMPNAPAQYAPAVAVSPDGSSTHVSWFGRLVGETYLRILYRQRVAGGWLTVEGPSGMVNYQREDPDVADLGNGSAGAVWRGVVPGGSCQLFYGERDTTGYWSAPEQLTVIPSGSVCEPAVAAHGRDLHVGWYDDSRGNQDVYYLHGTLPSGVASSPAGSPPGRHGPTRLFDASGRLIHGPARRPGVYFLYAAGSYAGRKLVVAH